MKKSFGLIEVVVSVAIIAMVLAALIGLASSSTKTSVSANNRLQAVYLAREGTELVRQVRDTKRLDTGSSCPALTGGDGYYDYSLRCVYITAFPNYYRLFDSTLQESPTPPYDATSITPSTLPVNRFAREINITSGGVVTSTVFWNEGGNIKNVAVTSSLSTWW